MFTLQDLNDKVEKRISEYIEFDVKEIFEQGDYITIYGGAVRDSLADLEIHDVDILCMPASAEKLRTFLKSKYNYTSLELYDQDALNMYQGISIIAEPWTLINDNKKIIQIIRPRYPTASLVKDMRARGNDINHINQYKIEYQNLIKNVDISCCGVFLEKGEPVSGSKLILKEACRNAIIHCLSKIFEINEWSLLYNRNRTSYREHKLYARGWYTFNQFNRTDKLKKERELKIYSLEFKPEYNYKIWSEDEYIDRPKNKTFEDLPF